ncbi:MAG: biotin/lipoyl-binding protein, partial [Spirulina sp. SIO3F2]|nr:biotin/lipoyl-binding protein [Spirulina sp. SIO3F2]
MKEEVNTQERSPHQKRSLISRSILMLLVVAPIGVMAVLTLKVLLPSLNNPESKFYSSSIGYPARQRQAGKPIQVKAVTVSRQNLESNLAAPGESVALQEVDVRPEITGVVTEVLVAEGEQVRQGQPLLRIESSEFEDQVRRAVNQLAIAQAQLEAVEISGMARLRQLENDVRSAQARLEEAEARLSKIDTLAEEQRKNRIEAAQIMVATAEKRLEKLRILQEKGAIAQFQLYDAEDSYAASVKELRDAQQGIFDDQNNRFINRDFYLTRQQEQLDAQRALESERETINRELGKAKLTVATRSIELEDAKRDLSRTVIYANGDGLVSSLNVHTGDFINAQWGYKEPLVIRIMPVSWRWSWGLAIAATS